jgi:hypothetical protein
MAMAYKYECNDSIMSISTNFVIYPSKYTEEIQGGLFRQNYLNEIGLILWLGTN